MLVHGRRQRLRGGGRWITPVVRVPVEGCAQVAKAGPGKRRSCGTGDATQRWCAKERLRSKAESKERETGEFSGPAQGRD